MMRELDEMVNLNQGFPVQIISPYLTGRELSQGKSGRYTKPKAGEE